MRTVDLPREEDQELEFCEIMSLDPR